MKAKKLTALFVVSAMMLTLVLGLVAPTVKAEVGKPDWSHFDELIKQIKSETDFEKREAIMHEAEDMLMDTGAICPLYYYNDVYMAKPDFTGFYSNLYGFKFFQFATNGDKDTVRLSLASEPDRLDPALNTSVDGACLAVNTFAGLYTYNEKGEVVPDCAESYEVSDDGLVYTFTMKDGLKWSDGSELTAKDFEYSWKRAVNFLTASDYSYMFESISGYPVLPEEYQGDDAPAIDEEKANELADGLMAVASEDGKTFTVTLGAPCAYFLDLCCFPAFFPVKKEAVESAKGYRDADGKLIEPGAWALEAGFVSNGPFTCKEWKHKESMVYEKNPNYHRADEVKLNTLQFMLSDENSVIFSAYQAGDLDFIDGIPTDEIKGLIESENPEFHKVDELGTYFVIFNVKSELYEGKTPEEASAMRRGLARLIDRSYIVETVAQTGQETANTFIPTGMANGHGGVFRENDEDYKYPVEEETGYFSVEPDIDGAIALLEEAGFKFDDNGMISKDTPLHIKFITNKSDAHQKIAELIQQDFAQVGITMEIALQDWKTFLNERKAGNYDVARHGWVADFNDPINMLEMWGTNSGNNDAQFGR